MSTYLEQSARSSLLLATRDFLGSEALSRGSQDLSLAIDNIPNMVPNCCNCFIMSAQCQLLEAQIELLKNEVKNLTLLGSIRNSLLYANSPVAIQSESSSTISLLSIPNITNIDQLDHERVEFDRIVYESTEQYADKATQHQNSNIETEDPSNSGNIVTEADTITNNLADTPATYDNITDISSLADSSGSSDIYSDITD